MDLLVRVLRAAFSGVVEELEEEDNESKDQVKDWRRTVMGVSSVARMSKQFHAASKWVVVELLRHGSIRDWPEKSQWPLIKAMCERRPALKLKGMSITLRDHVDAPLLLMLLNRCDTTGLRSLTLSLCKGGYDSFMAKLKGLQPSVARGFEKSMGAVAWKNWEKERVRTCARLFGHMAASMQVPLPSPEALRQASCLGLELVLDKCASLTTLKLEAMCNKSRRSNMGNFVEQHRDFPNNVTSSFIDALPYKCPALTSLSMGCWPKGGDVNHWRGHPLAKLEICGHEGDPQPFVEVLAVLEKLQDFDVTSISSSDFTLELGSPSLLHFSLTGKNLEVISLDTPMLRTLEFGDYFSHTRFGASGQVCFIQLFNKCPSLQLVFSTSDILGRNRKETEIQLPVTRPLPPEVVLRMRSAGICLCPQCR